MHWQQLGGIGECIEHVLEDYWRLVLVNCIGELYWRIVWKNCIGELHGGKLFEKLCGVPLGCVAHKYWRIRLSEKNMCCKKAQAKNHLTNSIPHRLTGTLHAVFNFFLTFGVYLFQLKPWKGNLRDQEKKQRTGPRKRIQAAEARDSARPAPSQLAAKLLKDWAWGRISNQYAQELAHKAVADMQPFECNLADLQFLAGLGTAGKFPNNMHRDVMKYINSPLPKLFPVPRLQLRTQLPNNFSNKPTSIPLRQKFLSKAT